MLKKKKFTDEENRILIENYFRGYAYCSNIIGCSKNQAASRAKKLGLKFTKQQKKDVLSKYAKSRDHKYYVDINDYINIKLPEVAYYLGFLWADGYIKENPPNVKLSIVTEDFLNIKPTLDKIGKFSYLRRDIKNCKPATTIALYVKNLTEFLVKNDYHIKSYCQPTKILSKISENLKHYWWRGYYDGDGTIDNRQYRICISAGINYNWDFASDLCKKIGIEKFRINRIHRKGVRSHQGESSFVIDSIDKIKIFLNYIYNGYPVDLIGLKRKYDLFSKIDSIYEENRINKIVSTQKTILLRKTIRGITKSSKNWRVRLCDEEIGIFTNINAAINCYNYYGNLKYKDIFIPNPVERFMEKEEWEKCRFKLSPISGFKGIYFNKKQNRWWAHVAISSKNIYVGSFISKNEAIIARNKYIDDNHLNAVKNIIPDEKPVEIKIDNPVQTNSAQVINQPISTPTT